MVSNCYRQRIKKKARKFNRRRPLVDYLRRYVKNGMVILDVASGPFPTIGTRVNGVMIRACDIAADGYYELMLQHNIEPLIALEYQDMEAMTYEDNSFDIVHCRNALDHTRNPKAALQEMARICKPWGRIHLRHYANVGDRNNYTGSHYWNLLLFEGDCKIWNHDEEFLMSDILPDVAVYMNGGMIACNWVK
jgi:ubiquinone/menaquinone biosynthesis C-methylase UbiE